MSAFSPRLYPVNEAPKTAISSREVVGVFSDAEKLQAAIKELGAAHFSRHQISVLGNEHDIKEKFGTSRVSSENLEDHPQAPHSANIAPEEVGVAQGALVATGILTGAAAAIIASGGMALPGMIVTTLIAGVGGSAIGAILATLLGEKYAGFFAEQVEKGGILLWVQVPTPERESRAMRILSDYGARDVHVHDIGAQEEV